MSLNSNNKRKGRMNTNNKLLRSRGSGERNMAEGVYSNSRLMHYVTSLVGCIVQVRVRNGNLYEGIFRSFSPQLDLVLEMTHKVDQTVAPIKGVGPAVSNLLVSFPFEDGINEKLIFRLKDVVMLEASNVDLDYAIKDNFTDTAISKFNGQITEKQLEPWEGSLDDVDSCSGLVVEDDDGSNGWDANEMFRMNAEKYGVKSSYDNTLQEYTVPLERKNTEEYKLQEAKALRIAQEIEATATYQSRIQLENGDEEDRFSAVVRPEGANSRYIPPQRRGKSVPGSKRPMPTVSSSPVHSAGPKHYPPSQPGTSAPSSSSNQATKVSHPPCTLPLSTKQSHNPSPCLPTLSQAISPSLSSVPVTVPSPTIEIVDKFSNGEGEEDDIKPVVVSSTAEMVTPVPPPPAVKATVPSPILQPLPPRPERRREIDKKTSKKGRDDEIEEFKKFSSNFKLSEENKECKEQEDILPNTEPKVEQSVLTKISDLKVTDSIKEEEEETASNIVKTSTLNPNAKEFVFNPNAKSFTPRSVAVASPQAPVPLQPPRMHTQSPVMAISHTQMVQGIPQHLFAAMGPPQYVMQATPVSMALTSQFATATLSQAPRFRKGPMMQPRHDISPQVHAATGQPILAPAAMPTPSQITMQYTPPPGMIPAPGPPQQTITYPPMYSVVGPRVMSPQPVGMVPTSHTATYCESPHMPTHYFMSAHPNAAALSAVSAAHSMQQGAQHSNPHPPQSHTPGVHPSPSPVHQPPPPHGNPSQAPTPTTVMYPGAAVNQHALQTGHPNHSQNHLVSHPHPTNFAGGPQPVVLMQQQGVPGAHSHHHHHHHLPGSLPSGPHPLHLHTIHSQNTGNHVGTPTLLPQMTVIPTSAAMVSAPTAMATSPFVPHPQGLRFQATVKRNHVLGIQTDCNVPIF